MPIKHVVIIVKENHTFDNYSGHCPVQMVSSAMRQIRPRSTPFTIT
jgi:phospholipase C